MRASEVYERECSIGTYRECSAWFERIGSISPAVISTPTRLITNESTSSTMTCARHTITCSQFAATGALTIALV